MTITFGTICTGVAGMDLGFEAAGMQPRWMVEINNSCRKVLRKRFPGIPLYEDATKEGGERLERVNVLGGGTPCQGFSIAGLRQGLADNRSNLCFHFCRIADELEPDVIVWENVPGVLSLEDNAFGNFLAALVGHDAPLVHPDISHFKGWWRESEDGSRFPVWPRSGMVVGPKRTACWRVLDSQYLGVAQRRERVYVVASPHSRRRPLGAEDLPDIAGVYGLATKILFEPEVLRRHHPPSRTSEEDLASTLGSSPEGSGWRSDPERMTFVPTHQVSPALQERGNKGADSDCIQAHVISAPLTTRPYGDNDGREGVLVFDETQVTSKTNRSQPKPGDPSHPLTESGRPPTAVMGFDKARGEFTGHDLAGTLRCNSGKAEGVNDGKADNQCVAFQSRMARNDRGQPEENICPTLTGANAGATSDMRPCVAFQPGNITHDRGSPPDENVAPALRAESDGDTRQCVAFHLTQDPIASKEVSPCHGAGSKGGQASVGVAYQCQGSNVGPAGTLKATDSVEGGVPFFVHSQNSKAMQKDGPGAAGAPAEVARALDTNGGLAGGQGGNVIVHPRKFQVRRLVPVECERLQAFPDDWTLHGLTDKDKPMEQKDSPRYRQIGNAVTKYVAEWIGHRIVKIGFNQ